MFRPPCAAVSLPASCSAPARTAPSKVRIALIMSRMSNSFTTALANKATKEANAPPPPSTLHPSLLAPVNDTASTISWSSLL